MACARNGAGSAEVESAPSPSSSVRAGHPPEAGQAPREGDEAVERMRAVYDKRRKLMVDLMRGVGFGIPVMPQGAFYVFANASRWTDDSYVFTFELLEKAGVGVAPGVDFGQDGIVGQGESAWP